jgi:hypothetical protein
MDTIPSPIYYTDKDLRYLGGNRAWAEGVVGMNIEDIIGRTIYEVCKKTPKGIAEINRLKDLELINTGGTQIFESRIICNEEKGRDFII